MGQIDKYMQQNRPKNDLLNVLRAFNYSKINKPKRYDKSVIQIFAEVRNLSTCLRTTMIPRQDIWNTKVIVIALATWYNNLNMTIVSLLKIGDETINQIQSILSSKKPRTLGN